MNVAVRLLLKVIFVGVAILNGSVFFAFPSQRNLLMREYILFVAAQPS